MEGLRAAKNISGASRSVGKCFEGTDCPEPPVQNRGALAHRSVRRKRFPPQLGRNLDTFLKLFCNIFKVDMVFGIEVVRNSEEACTFCRVLYANTRRAKAPYNCDTKYTSPLRVLTTSIPKQKP